MPKSSNEIQLGRVDICLDVKDVRKSFEFYSKMGFKQVEGNLEEGWAVLVHNNLRLGLYEGHIEEMMINFRGGDVFSITKALKEKGFTFEKDVRKEENGGAGATLRDPDGHLIYFNTYPHEKDILKSND